ncbi:hypothetical protein ADM98_00640 [Exiguobacterium sp. BMC-KP]|uniref:DUF262 domain-containing protein n=1 Tax=Exiguobacterium sp. BMC-KP TaxID=1684312 RepID=UPI0006AA2CBC|nr:DUF262 domain-containing protein [Exiguobacterium sp. BMC-KP]KOP31392.1 hypothetical protein ADM98_00640 [Exiguobacterium sp. BMC-KP]
MLNNIFKVFNNIHTSPELNQSREHLVDKAMQGEYNLLIDQARYPLQNLQTIFSNYNLKPDYQRKRVWDQKRKSKLIESLLVNVPIPPIFLYETDFNKYEVMDGLQRISTIISFFNNEFELDGLDLWSEINGFKFGDLPEELANLIRRRYLSAIIILKETNKSPDRELELKQFVFERLNTGGMELSPHEIRNAIYPSEFNSTINKLSELSPFRKMINNSDDELIRMEDRELILRFFAFKAAINCNYRRGIKNTLDSFAIKAKEFTDDETDASFDYFESLISAVYDIYGDKAFKKTKNGKFEKMIYDTVMLSISKLLDEEINLKNLKEIDSVAAKNEFIRLKKADFNGKYTSLKNIENRVSLFYNFLLEEIKNNE